jgi:hypothetical protein
MNTRKTGISPSRAAKGKGHTCRVVKSARLGVNRCSCQELCQKLQPYQLLTDAERQPPKDSY